MLLSVRHQAIEDIVGLEVIKPNERSGSLDGRVLPGGLRKKKMSLSGVNVRIWMAGSSKRERQITWRTVPRGQLFLISGPQIR